MYFECNPCVVDEYAQASVGFLHVVPESVDAALVSDVQLVKFRLEALLVEFGNCLFPPLLTPSCQVDDSIVELFAQGPYNGKANALVSSCYLECHSSERPVSLLYK